MTSAKKPTSTTAAHARPRSSGRTPHFLAAGGVAALIFAVFVAYAFLSRATYRTTALVVVEAAEGATPALPGPLEAARRLHEAVLRRELLQQLTSQIAAADGDQARLAAASRIRESLQVDTIDSREYAISYTDSDAARAQRFCNLLAQKAVEQAARALAPERPRAVQQDPRDARAAELIAFLAAHPDIGVQGAGGQAQNRSEESLNALHAEKKRLTERLAEARSDNPYGDPEDARLSTDQMKRRLAEIEQVTQSILQSRKAASERPQPKTTDAAKLEQQLRELLKGVSEAPAPAPPSAAPLRARLATPAPLPSVPVEPNRPRVLLIGLLVSMAFFGMVLVARASSQRRTRSQPRPTRPPSGGVSSTSKMPSPMMRTVAGVGPPLPKQVPAMSGSDRPVPAKFAATVVDGRPLNEHPPAAQTHQTGSLVPRAVVEVNAVPPGRDARRAETEPSAPPPERDPRQVEYARAPIRRVTQVLGSIPEAVAPRAERAWDPQRPESMPTMLDGAPLVTPPPNAPGHGNAHGHAQAHGHGHAQHERPSWAPNEPERPPVVVNTVGTSADGSDPPPPRHPSSPPIARTNVSQSWRPDPELVPPRRDALRDEILALSSAHAIVVGVTSSRDASEQKSRLAAELALSLSQAGTKRVLFMEGNFQHPNVHRLLGAMPSFALGLSQQLNLRARSADADAGWSVLACSRTLDVMAEGVLRSPGLMVSTHFDACLTAMRAQYDIIIIDGPTFSMEPECRVLEAVIDAVILFHAPSDDPATTEQASAMFSRKLYHRVVDR